MLKPSEIHAAKLTLHRFNQTFNLLLTDLSAMTKFAPDNAQSLKALLCDDFKKLQTIVQVIALTK